MDPQQLTRSPATLRQLARRAAWLLALLSACAPAPAPRTHVVQSAQPATYYPRQTGATWRFLPEGERRDAPPLVQRVEGPTVVDGARLIAWRTFGRGLDLRTYRDYRPEGVFIVREEGPGYVTTTSPPIQEWPAEGTLAVGLSWGGQTRATVHFTSAQETRAFALTYRFEVVDARTVTVDAGTFEVFVVAFESASLGPGGEVLETLRQEVWFAPFVGEVRTDSGLFLVSTTLQAAPTDP
ncbi:hypothetical protein [Truepera radiovictrix]|uniref:Lipoprotein n=1 Tax=Truepera radiovictrix (strain DSM 17093 / CIP 108686 / LMG 22925 / RQ-24) TaxID=649638 RepID=D7CUC2_TRURR|nr:hypothetical protein [Truepera radiovictrix]ADI15707.1 conserved hypothetical protein [Truepera radiovictrix DSM 17093]WMT58667.1 hypothetical protein RCV51_06895 [Truepera radiovictrix]